VVAAVLRAASGHAAAPPSNVMKSRRPITRSPRRRGREASVALRGRACERSEHWWRARAWSTARPVLRCTGPT